MSHVVTHSGDHVAVAESVMTLMELTPGQRVSSDTVDRIIAENAFACITAMQERGEPISPRLEAEIVWALMAQPGYVYRNLRPEVLDEIVKISGEYVDQFWAKRGGRPATVES